MPPPRSVSNTGSASFFNKKATPFKPPGPAKSASSSNEPGSASGSNAVPSRAVAMTISDDEEEFGTAFDIDDVDMEDLVESPPAQVAKTPATAAATPAKDQPRFPPPETTDEDPIPGVPPALLTRIMHEFYADKDTKISRDANAMMRRYVDVFIREAVARAAESQKEKRREEADTSKTGNTRGLEDDVWLDVEDLERITPSMLLDF
ncbi:Inner kinetochore subunit MHF2-like protein [Elsinoe fawcettii]|nr:Inner kinetochore subunit MHF2-like protein [Elsinoe fawcettii]